MSKTPDIVEAAYYATELLRRAASYAVSVNQLLVADLALQATKDLEPTERSVLEGARDAAVDACYQNGVALDQAMATVIVVRKGPEAPKIEEPN